MILILLEDGPINVPEQHQYHLAGRRLTVEFLEPGRWRALPLHSSSIPGKFTVMHTCFIACDIPLKNSLSFFTIWSQKLHKLFHEFPVVLICHLF
jgi:hypothetical protein